MDWSKIGAIATIIGVVVAIISIFISKKNSHKTNNQVIKGKVIKKSKIIQTKSNSGCDDNDQIIDVKKLYDNDIKQER